jgi:hypothetical protein
MTEHAVVIAGGGQTGLRAWLVTSLGPCARLSD